MTDRKLLKLSEVTVIIAGEVKTGVDALSLGLAHNLIGAHNYYFDEYDALAVKGTAGWSAAHLLARHGWQFTDPDVLDISDSSGHTVRDEMKVSKARKLIPSTLRKLVKDLRIPDNMVAAFKMNWVPKLHHGEILLGMLDNPDETYRKLIIQIFESVEETNLAVVITLTTGDDWIKNWPSGGGTGYGLYVGT